MPTPTSTPPVAPLLRRVDRIRRTYNLRELQRVCYMLVASGLTAASVLLVAALFGSTRLFAAALWSTLAALVVTSALLGIEGGRRRLRRERAVAWIETRTALRGRLRSLLELAGGTGDPGTRFFLPLLHDENARALPLWEPRTLIPRRVPRGALGTALASVAALLVALTLTPVLYPRVPELGDLAPVAGSGALATARGGDAAALPDEAADAPADDSTLARIPARAQESIRQAIWGDAWERAREALARAAEQRRQTRGRGRTPDTGTGAGDEDAWQLAERPDDREVPPERAPGRRRPADEAGAASEAAARRGTFERTDDGRTAESQAAAGAGAGSAPELYGSPALPPDLASRARFELGLVTRMRLQPRGRSADAPPPPARDEQPRLAGSTRREELAHEMAVPRAYEPIVRQVFAHRATEAPE